jgi:hypothetical protein
LEQESSGGHLEQDSSLRWILSQHHNWFKP